MRSLLTRQLVMFFGLAYLLAWIFFVPLAISKAGLGWIPVGLSLPVMTVLGTLGPSLAALITLRMTAGRWPKPGRISDWARFCGALLLCPVLVGGIFAVFPALLLHTGSAATLHWRGLVSFSVFGLSTVIGGPLGEEPGWRGFALPRLQFLMPPWKASLLLGLLWACWHLPLFLCLSWSSSSFPAFLLILAGLSLVMTFLFNLSRGSVLVAICSHAMFNTSARWLNALLGDEPVRNTFSPELVIGTSGIVVAALLILFTKGQLAQIVGTDDVR